LQKQTSKDYDKPFEDSYDEEKPNPQKFLANLKMKANQRRQDHVEKVPVRQGTDSKTGSKQDTTSAEGLHLQETALP